MESRKGQRKLNSRLQQSSLQVGHLELNIRYSVLHNICLSIIFTDMQYNLPVSFVCTVRGMLNGPLPALVIAAIVKLYVVNGLSDCMVMLVVVEDA